MLMLIALPMPGTPNGMGPVVQREPVPGVVEAPLGVVEREGDHHGDGQEEVDQREPA